jgi:hypothetical protein
MKPSLAEGAQWLSPFDDLMSCKKLMKAKQPVNFGNSAAYLRKSWKST